MGSYLNSMSCYNRCCYKFNYKVNEKASDSKTPTSKGWFLKAHNATGITFEIGDETPIESINLIASSAAIELAQLLINYN